MPPGLHFHAIAHCNLSMLYLYEHIKEESHNRELSENLSPKGVGQNKIRIMETISPTSFGLRFSQMLFKKCLPITRKNYFVC